MILLIGDIQGCCQAFDQLLVQAGFSPSRDQLVVLGDGVNRGPQSLAVLRRLMGLGNAAICLLGNHDLHLLAVAHSVRPAHRSDTLSEVLAAHDRADLLDWLRRRPLAVMHGGWLCVHAGVPPQWDAAQTLSLASEVSDVISGPALVDFLHVMYGNQPDTWTEALGGDERLRFIVNALTRMRFCDADGRLDLLTKEGLGNAPAGFMPWFDVPYRRTLGTPMAFGHWSTLGLINRSDLLSLDTGCVWGGALTAVRVDEGRREVIQVRCDQAAKPGY